MRLQIKFLACLFQFAIQMLTWSVLIGICNRCEMVASQNMLQLLNVAIEQ